MDLQGTPLCLGSVWGGIHLRDSILHWFSNFRLLVMKEEAKWNELGFKDKLSFVICAVAFVMGFVLSVAGFCVPPTGEISGSMLTWFGMVLTFVGSVLGISTHYNVELEKIKKEVKGGGK